MDSRRNPGTVDAIPLIALRPLEPRPGGFWTASDQSQGSFSFVYMTENSNDNVAYSVRPCTTAEEIQEHCGQFLFRTPFDSQERMSHQAQQTARNELESVSLLNSNHQPLSQTPWTQQSLGSYSPRSTEARPQSYASNQGLSFDHVPSIPGATMTAPDNSTFEFAHSFGLFDSHQMVVDDSEPISQSPIATSSTSGSSAWPSGGDIISTVDGDFTNQSGGPAIDPQAALFSRLDDSYNASIVENGWEQFSNPNIWGQVSTNRD